MKRLCYKCKKYKEIMITCTFCGLNFCDEYSCQLEFNDDIDSDSLITEYHTEFGCDMCKYEWDRLEEIVEILINQKHME